MICMHGKHFNNYIKCSLHNIIFSNSNLCANCTHIKKDLGCEYISGITFDSEIKGDIFDIFPCKKKGYLKYIDLKSLTTEQLSTLISIIV